jgi:predicted FMN-binding regulatory protein PaiB
VVIGDLQKVTDFDFVCGRQAVADALQAFDADAVAVEAHIQFANPHANAVAQCTRVVATGPQAADNLVMREEFPAHEHHEQPRNDRLLLHVAGNGGNDIRWR